MYTRIYWFIQWNILKAEAISIRIFKTFIGAHHPHVTNINPRLKHFKVYTFLDEIYHKFKV